MTKAIVVGKYGGPSQLRWRNVEVGEPKRGEILLRHTVAGLNYIDVYHRIGLYPIPLPFTPGGTGAGIVEAVGRGVTKVKPGDHVAYGNGPLGSYSEMRIIGADRVDKIPRGIEDLQVGPVMLQGLTAEYLVTRTFKVGKGHTILVHAAAGGVGLIMCQWAKHLGATVIGTVGSKKKADLAAAHGCDHPIIYTRQNFVDRVKRLTKGAGCDVVYDSVGKTTFIPSLDCLKPRGLLVSFGNASGPPPQIDPLILNFKGSLYLTRPTAAHYFMTEKERGDGARQFFNLIKKGVLKIEVNQTYALKDAAQAHRDLEARKTTGSTALIP
jgi:NADPH2:quinone reductase